MQRNVEAGRSTGQGWLGTVLLSSSVMGVPLVLFVLRRLGRWGGLLVEAGCGVLFVRNVTMTATGTPARLRPLPRLLLLVEVVVAGVATFVGLLAWVWRPFLGDRMENTIATAGSTTVRRPTRARPRRTGRLRSVSPPSPPLPTSSCTRRGRRHVPQPGPRPEVAAPESDRS